MVGVDGSALNQRTRLLARWSLKVTSGAAACSADGNLLAVGYRVPYASISLIDTSSGATLFDLSHSGGATGRVLCVAFSSDGARIASGMSNNVIWVWDVGSRQIILGPLEGHEGYISSIVFSPNGSYLVSGSRDETLRIWDAYSGRSAPIPLKGHTGNVSSIVISSDNSKVFSASWDKTIRVWDMQHNTLVLDPITGHSDTVTSIALSQDDTYIASGSMYYTVRVWDCLTGQMLLGPLQHKAPVYSIAISPDGSHISAGLEDGAVQIWDATNDRDMLGRLEGHSSSVALLTYSPDKTRIISYSKGLLGAVLCLFDAQSIAFEPEFLPGHHEPVLSIDFSPDGKHMVSGSKDTTLCIWDLIEGKLALGPLIGHSKPVHFVRFSMAGDRILSCSSDGTLRQWDAHTGDFLQINNPIVPFSDGDSRVMPRFDNPIEDTSVAISGYRMQAFVSASYSPDGNYIATASNYAIVCVWDSSSGEMILGPIKATTAGMLVEFSPDATNIIIGWRDGTVSIWDVQSGELAFNTPREGYISVRSFAFSPDIQYHVVAELESDFGVGTMHVRNTWTGERALGSFIGHTDSIFAVDFSPDSTRIVSGSGDKTLRIWNTQTGTFILGPLKGHTGRVRSVAYSPDGMYVASASDDATIRVWDISLQMDKLLNKHSRTPASAEWELNEDGWIVNEQSRRLIWVPPYLRSSLLSPDNTLLLARNGYVRLDFKGALVGEVWAECWLSD
ncbi:putative WD repeat-containing protein all2124 [Nostoc sp, PCC 7120] [Rhizoctonia solani]|uniref:Putative WD repeat-containing protein all2124 [Nostoc sp, PCC 7120] n=1 Tax=Rhizoctonia solani TaxID=456999 RepID=A0A0K6FYN8_9AGAM|nr:putative WD repeat-containing protein all2124 [Nostoc sp, PCC 7120] [Rhizoctonia solani]